VGENLADGELILNARDDLDGSTAMLTDSHIDKKNPLQSLRPRHGDMARDGRLGAHPTLPFLCLRPAPRARSARATARGGRKFHGSESG
jgi:hypothetical protein